jgi:hypothetical protein
MMPTGVALRYSAKTPPMNLVSWAKTRRLDVDTTQPRTIIEERDLTSAKALLEETRDRFAGNGQAEIWKFWHDQISAMNAESEFGGEATTNHPFHKTAFRAHLRTTGDPEPLLEYLAAEHAAGKPEATFELCAAYAELGRWSEALPLTETLLERVQTTEALRICCEMGNSQSVPRR